MGTDLGSRVSYRGKATLAYAPASAAVG